MVKKSARRTRRTHSPAFKARVALAALRDDKTMVELCEEFELHASQATAPVDLVPRHAKTGQLALEKGRVERARRCPDRC